MYIEILQCSTVFTLRHRLNKQDMKLGWVDTKDVRILGPGRSEAGCSASSQGMREACWPCENDQCFGEPSL